MRLSKKALDRLGPALFLFYFASLGVVTVLVCLVLVPVTVAGAFVSVGHILVVDPLVFSLEPFPGTLLFCLPFCGLLSLPCGKIAFRVFPQPVKLGADRISAEEAVQQALDQP